MSIDALIQGRLHSAPQARTAKTGSPFVTATVRVPTKDNGSLFASVITFSATVCNALMALQSGDAVSLAGELTPKVYQPKDGGEPRPSLDLVAHAVLTEYHILRKRKAVQEGRHPADASSAPPADGIADVDDSIPF
jgi:single-stranded DNA-binding protein